MASDARSEALVATADVDGAGNTSTGASQTLKARSIDVVSASRNPIMTGDTAHLGGVFRIAKLPVGDQACQRWWSSTDSFAIRNGDETPAILSFLCNPT